MQNAEQQAQCKPITFRPYGTRILVELVNVLERESPLHLDVVQTPHEYGKIVAMGHTVAETGLFNVGETVMFGQYSGSAVEEEKSMFIRMDDVVGWVDGGLVVPKKKQRQESEIAVVHGDPAALNGKFGKGPRG
jgi:co-chaperonin GroES (HSP10)